MIVALTRSEWIDVTNKNNIQFLNVTGQQTQLCIWLSCDKCSSESLKIVYLFLVLACNCRQGVMMFSILKRKVLTWHEISLRNLMKRWPQLKNMKLLQIFVLKQWVFTQQKVGKNAIIVISLLWYHDFNLIKSQQPSRFF